LRQELAKFKTSQRIRSFSFSSIPFIIAVVSVLKSFYTEVIVDSNSVVFLINCLIFLSVSSVINLPIHLKSLVQGLIFIGVICITQDKIKAIGIIYCPIEDQRL